MSDLLEKLIPYNKRNNHSISEAIFSILLPNKILNPNRFGVLISDNHPFNGVFQSFRILEGAQLNLQLTNDINTPPFTSEFSKTGEDGFQFEAYKDGKINWLIRYQPNQVGVIVLSIHCLNYIRWNDFYENVFSFLNAISTVDNGIFAVGFSLNYIDQFDWMDELLPPTNKLFKSTSKYIPEMLFETEDIWNFSSNYQRVIDKQKVAEHVNIGIQKVAYSKYNIFLLHNVAGNFQEIKNLKNLCEEKSSLKEFADKMHSLNKIFLKDILIDKILEEIGINEK